MNNAPLFRVWSTLDRKFLQNVVVDLTRHIFDLPSGLMITGCEIDLFTGKFADDKQPIYTSDKVEIATLTEFGSAYLEQGIMQYNVNTMQFMVHLEKMVPGEMHMEPTRFLRVLGHTHG